MGIKRTYPPPYRIYPVTTIPGIPGCPSLLSYSQGYPLLIMPEHNQFTIRNRQPLMIYSMKCLAGVPALLLKEQKTDPYVAHVPRILQGKHRNRSC